MLAEAQACVEFARACGERWRTLLTEAAPAIGFGARVIHSMEYAPNGWTTEGQAEALKRALAFEQAAHANLWTQLELETKDEAVRVAAPMLAALAKDPNRLAGLNAHNLERHQWVIAHIGEPGWHLKVAAHQCVVSEVTNG